MIDTPEHKIGTIGNLYGDLVVKYEGGKAYWCIPCCTGYTWEEIPDDLYWALEEFEIGRQSKEKK